MVGLAGSGPVRFEEVQAAGLSPAEMKEALAELVAEGRTLEIHGTVSAGGGESYYVSADWWTEMRGRTAGLLDAYHAEHPLRPGMAREELRSRLGLAPRQAEIVLAGLAGQGVMTLAGSRVAKTGFEPRPSEEDARRLADLRTRFEASPSSPPSIRECREAVGDELWSLVTIQGEFVEISEDVAFEATAYRRIVGEITTSLERGESVTVAEVRDRYQTSRKYALALLEHMDAIGVTVRVGDERRLKPGGNQNPGSPSG